MNRATHITLASLVAVSLVGCASDQPMDDQTQTKVEGTAIGTLLGAAIGGAIGGRDGAAIGAAIGAGAGYLVANEVAKRKAKYANEEDFLDGEIQYVAEYNENARKYNERLAGEIRDLEKSIASLERKIRSGKSQQSALQAKRDEVQEHLKKSRALLADLEKEYKVNQEILDQERASGKADDARLVKLEKEIALLQKNIDDLTKSTQQLAALDTRLSV